MERREPFAASASERPGSEADLAHLTVAELLVRWQETGCHATFERLVAKALPQVERAVKHALWRRGVRDPAAADDAVALVLDHLRRLAGSGDSERKVARFVPRAVPKPQSGDLARNYIGLLARDRAIDVVRGLRRRKGLPFSQLAADGGRSLEANLERDAGAAAMPPIDLLCDALAKLEPRQRTLVELLLAGKSQAVIAHVLGLSEGSVSRLRARAVAALRRLLAEVE